MDLSTKLGQRLVFGISGTTIPPEFERLVRTYKIGNVILFRENLESPEQTRALCAALQRLVIESTGYPAFITVDEEGGMVSRVPEGAVVVPGNMAVAATGKPENARACARIAARQLRGLGINANLAPVLDVNNNPQNPVIGVRSWGDCPEAVGDFAAEAIAGYAQEGVLCCGKHFPGHGDTAVDSHLGLPRIDKPMEALERTELVPFARAIRAGIPAIMSTHILFPQIEPEQVPGTMSRRIMTGLLREKLGFDGLTLSDCMTMDAIRRFYGTARGVVAAMRAGVDLVFVSHESALQEEAARAVYDAAARGELDEAEIDESVRRILAFKKRYAFTDAVPGLAGRAEDAQAVADIARQAVTCVSGPLFEADAGTFFCGCADYRASNAGNAARAGRSFPELLHDAFGGPYRVIARNPDAREIQETLQAAAGCGKVVAATLNGHLAPGQLELVRALAQSGKRVMAVAMRNPYDLFELPEGVAKVAAYDFNTAARQAVIDVLRGGACTGRLPVAPPERA